MKILKPVIFILSTDATITGTPVLLLNTLKWFKTNTNLDFVIVLQQGGELLDEFRSLYDIYLWPDNFKIGKKIKSKHFLLQLVKALFGLSNKLACLLFMKKIRLKYSAKLIYSNTTRNGEILKFFRKHFSAKVILHVHEGERTLKLFNHSGLVGYCINESKHIITVSESVKRVLAENYHATQDISVIPGGIQIHNEKCVQNRDLLREAGVPDSKKIIMCCGWMDWHKGTDFFIQIARYFSIKDDRLHFVWIGGRDTDLEYERLQFDIEKMELSCNVTLITSKRNAIDYINLADIFLVLSREESFSLVTLEAGLARKPVLCFDKSGGPVEILGHDPRFIVPYGDILKMIERIASIINDEFISISMGEYLYNRVIENYSIETCATSIHKVIDQQIIMK